MIIKKKAESRVPYKSDILKIRMNIVSLSTM